MNLYHDHVTIPELWVPSTLRQHQAGIRKASRLKHWASVHERQAALVRSLAAQRWARRSYPIWSTTNGKPSRADVRKQRGQTGCVAKPFQVNLTLAYLALRPQWDVCASPGLTTTDVVSTVKRAVQHGPIWVLTSRITSGFNRNHDQHLIDRCNVGYPLSIWLQSWLKAGLFDHVTADGHRDDHPIVPLLAAIRLHRLDQTAKGGLDSMFRLAHGTRVMRQANNLVLLSAQRHTLLDAIRTIKNFLGSAGLTLDPEHTNMVCTPTGRASFNVLGHLVMPRQHGIRTSSLAHVNHVTGVRRRPTKADIRLHKCRICRTVRRNRGSSQHRLINRLNVVSQHWASFDAPIATGQALDAYMHQRLWDWCRRRHQTLPHARIKAKYFHRTAHRNWVFSTYDAFGQIDLELRAHGCKKRRSLARNRCGYPSSLDQPNPVPNGPKRPIRHNLLGAV